MAVFMTPCSGCCDDKDGRRFSQIHTDKNNKGGLSHCFVLICVYLRKSVAKPYNAEPITFASLSLSRLAYALVSSSGPGSACCSG